MNAGPLLLQRIKEWASKISGTMSLPGWMQPRCIHHDGYGEADLIRAFSLRRVKRASSLSFEIFSFRE